MPSKLRNSVNQGQKRDLVCMVMVMMGVDEMVSMGRCMMVKVNEMRDTVQQSQKRDMMCMVMAGRGWTR